MRLPLLLGPASALALAVLTPCWAAAQVDPRAHAIEERLVAPCCWTESLATHESPLARSLRSEIEARVAAGEALVSIEQDLVARHGDRIRMVPPGLERVSLVLAVLLVGAALGLVILARRWRRRASEEAPEPTLAPKGALAPEGALDRRLEDELSDLEA